MGPSPAPRQLERNLTASLPEIGFCEEKHRLLLKFTEAVKEMGCLQEQQMRAVIDGNPDSQRLEPLLHAASQRKDAAKYELFGHIERHQC